MTTQVAPKTPATREGQLEDAQLDTVTGGTDSAPQDSPKPVASTLSNIMKKVSDTASSITQNIK